MTWKGEEDKNFDLNFFKRNWRYYLAIEAFSRKRWFGGGEAKNELKSNIAQWGKKTLGTNYRFGRKDLVKLFIL